MVKRRMVKPGHDEQAAFPDDASAAPEHRSGATAFGELLRASRRPRVLVLLLLSALVPATLGIAFLPENLDWLVPLVATPVGAAVIAGTSRAPPRGGADTAQRS